MTGTKIFSLTDFSIHIKADKNNDDLLQSVYKAYLTAYVEMAKNAEQLPPEASAHMKEGIEKYVSTLLGQGGPAVDVFKKILGPDGQKEYVRGFTSTAWTECAERAMN